MANASKWDKRFIGLAEYVAQWSKDPSTKTGAVVVDSENRIISLGYNGLSRGVEDTDERLSNRELKYKIIVHAEANAMLFAPRLMKGARIYVWPFMTCVRCATMVIQAGIAEVIAPESDNPRWVDEFNLAKNIFGEAGVKVKLIK